MLLSKIGLFRCTQQFALSNSVELPPSAIFLVLSRLLPSLSKHQLGCFHIIPHPLSAVITVIDMGQEVPT